jgi:hypothetical protein
MTSSKSAAVLLALAAAAASLAAAAPPAGAAGTRPTALHGDMYYYQTQYSHGDSGDYVSIAPTWKKLDPATGKPWVTDLFLAAGHFGYDADGTPYIHLNDFRPDDPWFDPMWPEVATAQAHGIHVHFMLGGSAPGTFTNLFAHFDTFYPLLKKTLKEHRLDGLDIDVEESITLAQVEMLITQVHRDFGNGFAITLAPVASDLTQGFGLSGFDYKDLYQSSAGRHISWFNTQFYSGFGSLQDTSDYDTAVANGFPPSMIVAGVLDSPDDGYGYVDIPTLEKSVGALAAKYPDFAGVNGWEYFNAMPGGTAKPITFAVDMGKAMKTP